MMMIFIAVLQKGEKMSEMMEFPETWEEFEKSYGFDDSEEVYTNGSRLIPSFRVKQWLDHIAQKETKQQAIKASDCINRQDAIVNMASAIWHYPNELYTSLNCFDNCQELAERALNSLPSSLPCPEGFDPKHLTEQDKKDILEALDWVKGTITEEVPSAQPEIIRCKDCIKRDCCRTTNIWAVPPDDDWYCGDAERREDERNDI